MSNARLKIRPEVILIGILAVAVIACGAILLYKKFEPQAQADSEMPLAARIDQTDGDVGVERQLNDQSANGAPQQSQASLPATSATSSGDWAQVTRNTPVSVGDRICVRDGSHAGVAFSGRRYARLDSGAFLDVLSLNPTRTQLALRDGTAMFDIGDLSSGQLFEVATPCGAIDFNEPGLYQVSFGTDGNTVISVLNGAAQVVGLAGSGHATRGEMLTLAAAATDQAFVSNLQPDYCGRMVDSYYKYRYPSVYDGRYADYQHYIASPDYDPYDTSASHHYISDDSDIAGLEDLDEYGRWQDVSGYGQCWSPNEDEGWAPYRQGYWVNDGPVGLSWVSSEAWGWAPYHYGRWASVDSRWYWVPGREIDHPVYSPALVAFVPVKNSDDVAWVPLGPTDPYAPCYYDSSFHAHYIGRSDQIAVRNTVYNLEVPGAVTAVPLARFTGLITAAAVVNVNPRDVAGARPLYNPFDLQPVRHAVVAAPVPEAVARVDVPRSVIQQTYSRPVITSVKPVLPPVVRQNMLARVDSVRQAQPNETKRALKLNKTGQVIAPVQAEQAPAEPGAPSIATRPGNGPEPGMQPNPQLQARMQNLQEKAARGNAQAEQKLQRLQQQQQAEQQQAQAKAERKAERQQSQANTGAQVQQQQEQERLQKQQQQQQQQLQQQQLKQQRKEVRQQQNQQQAALQQQQAAAQQQRIAARQQAEAAAAAERSQQKAAERRAEAAAAAQRTQEREARRQQAAQQQQNTRQPQAQQQAQPPAQNKAEQKAEKKAERKAQRNGHGG